MTDRRTPHPAIRQLVAELTMLRLARGVTQERIAARLDVSTATVAKWEGGTRSPSSRHLAELAAMLGCEIALIERPTAGEEATR
jgi:Predicted transcriptional regulators